MARQLFINPKDTERLYLWPAEGKEYWIDVKSRLSVKEEKAVQSAGINHLYAKGAQKTVEGEEIEPPDENTDGVKIGLDVGAMKLKRAELYIVAWSFSRPNSDGSDVAQPVNAETIGDLLPEVFDEIETQIDAFIAKRVAEKKAPSGVKTPD